MQNRITRLTCCVCGRYTQGRQWYNRDKGYGICVSCAFEQLKKETPQAMTQMYGEIGYHYFITAAGLEQ